VRQWRGKWLELIAEKNVAGNRAMTDSRIQGDVTRILGALEAGNKRAAENLLPLVYDELRKLARRRMAAEAPEHTLEPTALVHEAYLRLLGDSQPAWSNRGHFFAAAALAMRRILVEHARGRHRLKRGGGRQRVPWDENLLPMEVASVDVLDLDEALTCLEAYDPRKCRIVMLRYFAGLTIDETAQALDISVATVKSDWTYARAWLHRELKPDETRSSGDA